MEYNLQYSADRNPGNSKPLIPTNLQYFASEGSTKTGGAYKDVPANGGQVHHMPADSVSPYSKNAGPGIRMDTPDHMKTVSWGRSKSAQEYRAIQKN